MPTLISPGVSVTVQNESFYTPASAPTVPLIILATAEHKKQSNGTDIAIGTYEHSVIRTVTSITQSMQLYGVPKFYRTNSGEPMHGDSRNEYGLLALNQFLGLGNRAYAVRANVNLNDNRADILTMWLAKIATASSTVEVLVNDYINEYNSANGLVSTSVGFKQTVSGTELLALIKEAMLSAYDSYNFSGDLFKSNFEGNFNEAQGGTAALDVYNTDFTSADGTFLGVEGAILDWELSSQGSTIGFETEWSATEANTFLSDLADDYSYTVEFLNETSLGSNDATKRTAIVTALQAAANLPNIRADKYEFNLVLCPGYFELADELVSITTDVNNEAFAIVDAPMDKDPDEVVTWADDPTSGRVYNDNVAYYYSHGLTSNVDGVDVLGAASGIALRTFAYSDNASTGVWAAPAGAQRGVVTGVSQVGYFKGTPGSATTFHEAVLTQGQRDNMYKDETKLNPITFLPGRGITVMGQKTSSSTTSSLDRVNVVRLMAYIRRALRKSTFAFVFEPNDQLTRDNLKSMVDGFLSNLIVKHALYDYATLCSDINNTPDRIDRGEMYIEIALKPVRTAEFIYVPIRVLSTGAEL